MPTLIKLTWPRPDPFIWSCVISLASLYTSSALVLRHQICHVDTTNFLHDLTMFYLCIYLILQLMHVIFFAKVMQMILILKHVFILITKITDFCTFATYIFNHFRLQVRKYLVVPRWMFFKAEQLINYFSKLSDDFILLAHSMINSFCQYFHWLIYLPVN